MSSVIRWTSAAAFGVVGAVLLLVSAMGYRTVRYSNDANHSVAHTYQVLNALDNVLTNLVDAETGTRGYGITGMSRYLEPFERAKSELPANIDAVAALTVDNPAQHRRADELRAQSTATMALLQQIVSLARSKQPIPLDLRDPAKANMDVVRATLQQMRLEERGFMEQRNLSASNAAIATQAVMLGLTAIAFGVMLVSFLLVDRRAIQLRQANEMLGDRLRERTALLETALASERAVRRQAENAQARFQRLVESAPTAMIAVDKQGAIVLVNALTERLFGYRRDELVGKSVEMLVPERFRLNHPRYRAEFSDAPQSRPMGAGRDLYGVRRDGSEVPIEIGLNPIDVDSDPLVLSSIVDITDRKRADQERARLLNAEQQARAEAEEANRSKDLFLARVSHELRTPLNALMGWTRMLRDGQLLPARVPTVIGSVDRNCEVLKTLVDDLVEMSRIRTGKLQLNRSRLDVVTVVRESMSLLESAAKAKDIKVEMDIDSEPMVVDGDPTRLRQVFWNLLSNAIRFTPPEGRVVLSVRLNDGEAEIRVVDTGQGIVSEFLPHVFEPFSQSEIGGQGLGLGLSIVRHLVKAHDGRISVTSPGVGAGATFTVNLPVLFMPDGP